MNEIRKKRLESSIRRELAALIQRTRAKDDRFGLVSVTEVRLADDLSTMTVLVSAFGSEEENEETWQALSDHAASFQTTIGRTLRLRQTPALVFEADDRIKEGDRILEIMDRDPSAPG